MTRRTQNILMTAWTVVFLLLATASAFATGTNRDNATATAEADAAAQATASMDGIVGQGGAGGLGTGGNADTDVDYSDNSVTENNSSNVVLVPNNNTEKCLRVFGFAFGRDGDSAAFGIPWRADQCDFGQFAAAADAQGELNLGWYWRCHMKSAYNTFKDKGENKATAIEQCHDRMVNMTGMRSELDAMEARLEAAQNQIDLLRSHEEVCNESLDRCNDDLYGGK